MTRGVGKYQIEKSNKALLSIIKAISKKEKRHMDIKKETGLNDPTLAKYLKPLLKLKLIKKRVDLESGKYPYPAYYKAEPELLTWVDAQVSMKELSQQIEPVLLETKNPFFVLNLINISCQSILEITFIKLKEEKNVPDHKLRFLLDLFVWEPYRVLTWKLIEATKKHIDKISLKVDSEENLLERLKQLEKKTDNLGE